MFRCVSLYTCQLFRHCQSACTGLYSVAGQDSMHVGDTLSAEINMKQTKPRSVLMCLLFMIKVYESCIFLFAKETPRSS